MRAPRGPRSPPLFVVALRLRGHNPCCPLGNGVLIIFTGSGRAPLKICPCCCHPYMRRFNPLFLFTALQGFCLLCKSLQALAALLKHDASQAFSVLLFQTVIFYIFLLLVLFFLFFSDVVLTFYFTIDTSNFRSEVED